MNNNDTLVKWEYCQVNFPERLVSFFKEDEIKQYTLPRKEKKVKAGIEPSAWRYMAGLGKQGWELISINRITAQYVLYIFKRPIQD